MNQSRPNVGQYRPGVCTDSTRKTVGPSSSAVPVTKTREDFARKKTSEDRLSPYRIPYPCWPNPPKPSPRAEEQLAQTAGSGKFSGPARRRNELLNKIGGNPARGMPRGMKPRIVALLFIVVSPKVGFSRTLRVARMPRLNWLEGPALGCGRFGAT